MFDGNQYAAPLSADAADIYNSGPVKVQVRHVRIYVYSYY